MFIGYISTDSIGSLIKRFAAKSGVEDSEINNQRKAFLDMLAWSEGTDNGRQKTRNHGYDVIVGELLLITPITLANLSRAKPKTQINRRRTLRLLPVSGMPTTQAAWPERLLSESQDAVALQQIKERGALPMIDRGDIRQAIDRCSNIWASLPGAGYGQFEHKADNLIAKFKAGGTVREIDVWAKSPRLSPLWLSASSSACHGLLIITVITPLPTKPGDKKCQRTGKLANTPLITDMQMRQRDVAALDAKYTKELADAKEANDALRDDVAAGRRRLHIKAVCQSVRGEHHRLRRG